MRRSHFHGYVRASLAAALVLAVLFAGTAFAEEGTPSPADASRQITLSAEEAALFEQFAQVKSWIQEFSPRDVTLERLYQGATKGMVEAINDPYSQYLTKEQYDSLSSSLEGEYVGIGVTIDLVDGQITVVNTFKGSPAEEAGVKAGDVITGVGGADMRGKVPRDAQALLRGMCGTPVTVTIRRPSENLTLELHMVRTLINLDSLEVKDLGGGIWYLRISQFTTKAARDFTAVTSYLHVAGIKGIVLDLRGNPGGLLDACVDIASRLVPKGLIVELRRKDLKDSIENKSDPPIVPIAVLVNKGSASASEILAGAIRDRGVGILVGETTFGKACVQSVVSLGENGGLRLTIADYYTPSGISLASTGLVPDVKVAPPKVTLPPGLSCKRPLTPGLVGLDVLALQESLQFLGYDAGEADGVFGQRTESATVRFSADYSLQWEGSFGETAAERLNAAVSDTVLNRPDMVLDAGVRSLRARLSTGTWQ